MPTLGSLLGLPGETPRERVSRTANLSSMARKVTPVGTSVADDLDAKRARNPHFSREHDRLQPFEELARVVILRRARLGLSQQDLAERMGTTASVISRIESGQHRTSTETLRRIGEALGGHAVVGFDFGTDRDPQQELVRL